MCKKYFQIKYFLIFNLGTRNNFEKSHLSSAVYLIPLLCILEEEIFLLDFTQMLLCTSTVDCSVVTWLLRMSGTCIWLGTKNLVVMRPNIPIVATAISLSQVVVLRNVRSKHYSSLFCNVYREKRKTLPYSLYTSRCTREWSVTSS